MRITRVVRTYAYGTKKRNAGSDSQSAQGAGEMAARLTLPKVRDATDADVRKDKSTVDYCERLTDYRWLVNKLKQHPLSCSSPSVLVCAPSRACIRWIVNNDPLWSVVRGNRRHPSNRIR